MVMAELEWLLGFPPYLESMVKNLGSCFDKPNVQGRHSWGGSWGSLPPNIWSKDAQIATELGAQAPLNIYLRNCYIYLAILLV